MEFFRTVRTVCLIFLAGGATGAYGQWKYSHALADDLQTRMVEGGWCAQADPRKVVYLFACRDAYYAAQLQQHDTERAEEVTAILNDMEINQPKRSKNARATISAR